MKRPNGRPPPGEMTQKVRRFDWSTTPLGPIESWPPELRTAAAFVLENRFPAALIWGPELVTIYNDAFRPILGNKPEALGRSFADVWSEAWQEIGPIAERAFAGESTFIEDFPLEIDRTGEPEQAFFTFSYSPVRAADGRICGMIDTVVETTAEVRHRDALRTSERDAQTLLAELQHRVRNTLAVVRSIARRTAERSPNVDEMISHFEGRLNAFARVQSAVTRTLDAGVDIKAIVEDELLAVAAREGKQLRIRGPEVCLRPKAAESISLAVHELATNAVKYGALSVPKGRIRITWDRIPDHAAEELRLEWVEAGLDARPQPTREGFGHEMLLRTLPYDLQAKTRIEFTNDGIRFSMRMPLRPDVLAE